MIRHIIHLLLGILFGIILVKSEVISWFRIQEMFHFQSFHMVPLPECGHGVSKTRRAVLNFGQKIAASHVRLFPIT